MPWRFVLQAQNESSGEKVGFDSCIGLGNSSANHPGGRVWLLFLGLRPHDDVCTRIVIHGNRTLKLDLFNPYPTEAETGFSSDMGNSLGHGFQAEHGR